MFCLILLNVKKINKKTLILKKCVRTPKLHTERPRDLLNNLNHALHSQKCNGHFYYTALNQFKIFPSGIIEVQFVN